MPSSDFHIHTFRCVWGANTNTNARANNVLSRLRHLCGTPNVVSAPELTEVPHAVLAPPRFNNSKGFQGSQPGHRLVFENGNDNRNHFQERRWAL
jgi:hypothetical protein